MSHSLVSIAGFVEASRCLAGAQNQLQEAQDVFRETIEPIHAALRAGATLGLGLGMDYKVLQKNPSDISDAIVMSIDSGARGLPTRHGEIVLLNQVLTGPDGGHNFSYLHCCLLSGEGEVLRLDLESGRLRLASVSRITLVCKDGRWITHPALRGHRVFEGPISFDHLPPQPFGSGTSGGFFDEQGMMRLCTGSEATDMLESCGVNFGELSSLLAL